jgi:hypothetical protein
VLMSMLDLMDDPKVPVLSSSNLLMMPAMPFNSSTVTTGKDALLKFVRIDLRDLLQALAAVEVLVAAAGLEEALAVEEASGAVGVSVVVALAVDVVVTVVAADMELVLEVVLIPVLEELLLPHQTPLPILLLLEPTEARSSMSAMYVLCIGEKLIVTYMLTCSLASMVYKQRGSSRAIYHHWQS